MQLNLAPTSTAANLCSVTYRLHRLITIGRGSGCRKFHKGVLGSRMNRPHHSFQMLHIRECGRENLGRMPTDPILAPLSAASMLGTANQVVAGGKEYKNSKVHLQYSTSEKIEHSSRHRYPGTRLIVTLVTYLCTLFLAFSIYL